MKEKIAEAMAMKRNMSGALRDLQKRPSSPEVDTLSYQLTRSMEDLKEEMLAVREDLTQAEGVLEELLLMVEDLSIPLDPVRTEPPGARPCPKEGCRGFVKGTPEWACGLCNSRVCPRCERIEATGHRCVAEDVETARLIRRDTKPCPGCAAPIEKIDGCDQMFCVSCTTVFSWDTGRVQATGQVHNPEYFRWLRDRGEEVPRDPDDTPCGPRDNLPPYQVVLPLGDACNRAYDALLTNVNWYRNWREQPDGRRRPAGRVPARRAGRADVGEHPAEPGTEAGARAGRLSREADARVLRREPVLAPGCLDGGGRARVGRPGGHREGVRCP
jgi:hypothetical protein